MFRGEETKVNLGRHRIEKVAETRRNSLTGFLDAHPFDHFPNGTYINYDVDERYYLIYVPAVQMELIFLEKITKKQGH